MKTKNFQAVYPFEGYVIESVNCQSVCIQLDFATLTQLGRYHRNFVRKSDGEKQVAGGEHSIFDVSASNSLPKTKQDLQQFLQGTKWLNQGVFVELLPEGKFRQSNKESTFRWEAVSATEAVTQGRVPFEMI